MTLQGEPIDERNGLLTADALEVLAEWVRNGNERFATIGRDKAWKVTLHSPAGSARVDARYLTVAIREAALSAIEANL